MIRAKAADRELIIEILASSFADNKSVNYLVPQDRFKMRRLKRLMAYSFDICNCFGEVWLTENRKACALILFPEKKKFTIQSLLWDTQLITTAIGLKNALKAISREKKVAAFHPKKPIYYLWFIGVSQRDQHQGNGTRLMKELISRSKELQRPIYLETSTLKNIPWYLKQGFRVFAELDLGYQLYFLSMETKHQD